MKSEERLRLEALTVGESVTFTTQDSSAVRAQLIRNQLNRAGDVCIDMVRHDDGSRTYTRVS